MSIFTGSAVAIITPFNADGSINYDAFKNMVETQIAAGTSAIAVACTTGEASTIDDAEQIVYSAVKLSIPPPPKNIQLVNLPKICRRFCGK